MAHRNAPLTPEGRRRLCERVDAGRPICHVAAEAGIARQTLAKWHARWELDGEDGLQDRSSRPDGCPRRTDPQVEDLIEWLRRGMMLGPVMLVAELVEFGVTMAASTIHQVLLRRGISRLRDLELHHHAGTLHRWQRPDHLPAQPRQDLQQPVRVPHQPPELLRAQTGQLIDRIDRVGQRGELLSLHWGSTTLTAQRAITGCPTQPHSWAALLSPHR